MHIHNEENKIALCIYWKFKRSAPIMPIEQNHVLFCIKITWAELCDANCPILWHHPSYRSCFLDVTTHPASFATNNFLRTRKCWPFICQIKRICSLSISGFQQVSVPIDPNSLNWPCLHPQEITNNQSTLTAGYTRSGLRCLIWSMTQLFCDAEWTIR